MLGSVRNINAGGCDKLTLGSVRNINAGGCDHLRWEASEISMPEGVITSPEGVMSYAGKRPKYQCRRV
jgi:hypothetical protein